MRVLMIAPTPFFADRGCHVRIYEEVRALQKLGHQVTITTYHIGRTPDGLDVRRIAPLLFWYKKYDAGPSWWKVILDLLLLFRSLALTYTGHYDVIHAHLHEGCVIGAICSRLHWRRIPVVFDAQGGLSAELVAHGFIRPHGLLYRFARYCERHITGLCDATIASNANIADELARMGARAPVHVVHDGVDTDDFYPRRDAQVDRAILHLPPTAKVVAYLGLLTSYQGIDVLLEAIPRVLARAPEAHFLIMGYPNVDRYRELAESLGVADAVSFLGKIDYRRAPEFLRLADVAVSPKLATTEANGKLYNYMATGLPIAAFDVQTNRDILGAHAAYARVGESESLADALASLLTDPEHAARLGALARQRAVALHSWTRSARTIGEIYAQLLEARTPAPVAGRRQQPAKPGGGQRADRR